MLVKNEWQTINFNYDRIPVFDETDILIIGGGSAGCVAALAARLDGNYKLSLVKRYGFLAGTSTQMLDTFYGFFTPGETPRKKKSEFWPAELLIDSGYAIASFYVFDAAPDNKEHYQEGVLQLYPDQLSAGNGMKAIGAWSWAASRVMDYFEKDKDINSKKIFCSWSFTWW